LQRPKDRKAHVEAEAAAVVVAVHVDPEGIHCLPLFHLVAWSILIEFVHTQEQ
jgi:hypothetical protein